MIEIGLPWKYNMFESPKVPPGLAEVMAGFYEQGVYPPSASRRMTPGPCRA
jgi:hypothetical protein